MLTTTHVPLNTRKNCKTKAFVTWTKFIEITFKSGFINGYVCTPKFTFINKYPESNSYLLPQKMYDIREIGSSEATDDLFSLASGSSFSVNSYTGCVINGMKWLTYACDYRRKT